VIRTTCPYCGVGCGVQVQAQTDGWAVQGDAAHPANLGRLCVKGAALGETLSDHGRLTQPMRRARGAAPQAVSWDAALDEVAAGFAHIIDTHGPEAVAFYVSGQLLTEDYYVANKLMKGFIGSANIDTNSRLCMSSAVAGHTRAFGEDWVPVSYTDVEQADLVILSGSNLAWCHPVLYQRLAAAKAARPQMRVVVIDPRRTATCDLADLHLPIRPDSDVRLWNRLLVHLAKVGAGSGDFLAGTSGADAAVQAARAEADDPAQVAADCGVQAEALARFEDWFATTEKVVTLFSQGVNQSASGSDKVNAIINAHLYTGRIGRPGMGPLSITGQPNAMGGREVGGLANQLAAHLKLESPRHRALVQQHWQAPRIADTPGLKAVDLFEALHEGRVKAVWIMATNPVVSLPDADRVRAALARAELVVVSDAMAHTDTTALADVLLPATTWGERDGTVTNSERCISRQRPFRTAPGEARPDWWILSRFAAKMGWGAHFDYTHAAGIFDEYTRLTAAGNQPDDSPRLLHLGGLSGMTAAQYDALQPVRWPVPAADTPATTAPAHYRLIATPSRSYPHAVDADWPLVLNTGRVRDQWHTMSRTGMAPTLAGHRAEPVVDLHPEDALLSGVRIGELARVQTRWGALVARTTSSGDMRRGEAFVPIHWNDRTASDARVGALVAPVVDPVSGEPAFKHTPARVVPFPVNWQGFVMSRLPVDLAHTDWWVRVQGAGHVRFEMAGRQIPDDWSAALRRWLGVPDDADWIEAADPEAGIHRAAWLVNDRLQACVFISPRADLPHREWLSGRFGERALSVPERAALLAGAPLKGGDAGPTVCACFSVGRNTLIKAIRGGCLTPQAVTAKLRAGGNCGSCLPEIRTLIADLQPVEAA